MATEKTGRESDKFMLRFPDGMRARIKAVADKNNRTMNAEIISRLEDSLTVRGRADIVRDEAHELSKVDAGLLKIEASLSELNARLSQLPVELQDALRGRLSEAQIKSFTDASPSPTSHTRKPKP